MNHRRYRVSPDWVLDCLHWRGRVLTGRHGHWCFDWDELPIDETCPEWPCCEVAIRALPRVVKKWATGAGNRRHGTPGYRRLESRYFRCKPVAAPGPAAERGEGR